MPRASSAQTVSPKAIAATIRLRSSEGTGLKGAESWTDASIEERATVASTADGRCHGNSGGTQRFSDTRTQMLSAALPNKAMVARPG